VAPKLLGRVRVHLLTYAVVERKGGIYLVKGQKGHGRELGGPFGSVDELMAVLHDPTQVSELWRSATFEPAPQ